MLPLVEPISEEKSPYTDALDRRDPAGIDEKMPDRSEAAEMPEVKLITPESEHTTSTRSRSGIQSIQS